PPLEKRVNHTAESRLGSGSTGGGGQTISLTQRFTEANYYCSSAVAADVVGRSATEARLDERTIQLTLPASQGIFVVRISSAGTSRGKYPTKFNGMLWTTGGDKRQWGTQYWGANQSCLYNSALLAANHAELEDCMFDMYRAMLPSLEQAAREQWGSQGAFIP